MKEERNGFFTLRLQGCWKALLFFVSKLQSYHNLAARQKVQRVIIEIMEPKEQAEVFCKMCCTLVNCTIKSKISGQRFGPIFTRNHHCRSNRACLNINPSSQLITRRHCKRGEREREEGDEMNWDGENVSPLHFFTRFRNRGDKRASAICEQADCDRISVRAGNSN